MLIDIHGHQYPDAFRDEFMNLVKRGDMPAPEYSLPPWRVGEHLALNDEMGIDRQVLSLTLQVYPSDPAALRDLLQAGNEGLAEVCRRHPDRFTGFAALPLVDIDASVQELHRAVNDLGMKGVILPTNVQGEPIDGEAYNPLYQEIDRLKLPVLLHPVDPKGPAQAYAHRLELWVGWPMDTTLAAARLVMTGVLDRFPNLTLILSHLGGGTHYLLGRICEGARRCDIERPAMEYYREMYYDTAGPVSSSAVLCAHDLFGAERIVYGTDYPFGPELGRDFIGKAIACVKELSLPPAEEKAIFSENARTLLGF
jgi:aminocarboxymuconate-semialdehyde decarboxylase